MKLSFLAKPRSPLHNFSFVHSAFILKSSHVDAVETFFKEIAFVTLKHFPLTALPIQPERMCSLISFNN